MTPERAAVAFEVNGEERHLLVRTTRTLLDVLRDELLLTGTKRGCDQGVCGTCTVLCDGEPIRACLALAVAMAGRSVVTVEAEGEKLLPVVRQAFVDSGAVQCGFCIPGMVMSTVALLGDNPRPTEEEIREGLSGNLCRCTGYVKIVDAVALAARRLTGDRPS
jgi:carbon-monoxide dehydrogenase small subunit